MSDALVEPPAPPALGPGDDDPRSPAAVAADGVMPLGPGEDDPASPAVTLPDPVSALGPGDADGPDPHAGYVLLAPPPALPGATAVQRTIVRIPQPARPADE